MFVVKFSDLDVRGFKGVTFYFHNQDLVESCASEFEN